jgi:hypothetical protein
VDAYEPHAHYADIGGRIVEATGLQVQWLNKRLEEEDLVGKEYDVALMLSVFQWVSRGNEQLEQATSLLQAVSRSARVLFFELGCNHGKCAIHTDERPIAWVWRLLQQNTTPKHVCFLGSTAPWSRARRYVFACADDPINLTPWQRFMTQALQKRWIR